MEALQKNFEAELAKFQKCQTGKQQTHPKKEWSNSKKFPTFLLFLKKI